MPNHVTNHLYAPPEVLAALTSEEEAVDFSSVIPMPESIASSTGRLDITGLAGLICSGFDAQAIENPTSVDGVTARLAFSNNLRCLENGGASTWNDEEWDQFIDCLQNIRKHGHSSWYDWSIATWGTKWNAYDVISLENGVGFNTAWSPPHPVIETLAKRFPDAEIYHEWADEDTGNNVGYRRYRGDVVEEQELSDTKEGYELAFKLCGGEDYYRLVDGQYIYIEDEIEEEG